MDKLEIFVDKQEIDVGVVSEITEHSDGVDVVIYEQGSDFELGFSIYYDQYSIKHYNAGYRPRINTGDQIEIVGHEAPEGIRKLTVNDFVWFEYNKEQARIIKQIRKRTREIVQLQEELNGRAS